MNKHASKLPKTKKTPKPKKTPKMKTYEIEGTMTVSATILVQATSLEKAWKWLHQCQDMGYEVFDTSEPGNFEPLEWDTEDDSIIREEE